MTRHLRIAATLLTLMAVLGVGSVMLERRAAVEAAGVEAPMFEVDPMWPMPLPNHWVMGWTVGVGVDRQDHVWVVHQANKLEPPELWGADKSSSCCFAAPPVLEFDQAGNLIGHWGGPGPGYDWMDSNHGITVDYKGNVWIGGNGRGTPPGGRGPAAARGRQAAPGTNQQQNENQSELGGYFNDNMVLKFTPAGKFIMQIGKAGQSKGSNDVKNLRLPAKTFVDQDTNEVYVADG